jgi:hypothetical protein
MESYKNNIQLNTTLLEQQKQLMIMNTSAIEKQRELCDTLDKFIENLTKCSQTLSENHSKVVKLIEDGNNCITNTISSQMITCSVKTEQEHTSIKNKINLLYVGIGSIVLAVIGLTTVFADKFLHLSEIVTKVVK